MAVVSSDRCYSTYKPAQTGQASTVTLLNWLSSQDDVVIQVRSYDRDILQLF